MTITVADDAFCNKTDVNYTLVVNERQLHYIRLALREFIGSDPNEELDEFGRDIPTVLEEMLSEDLVPSPDINRLTS